MEKKHKLDKMDRISNLPDEVLCHVLSFLKTKEAALTSVLAKRWRYLLAFVPKLDLNDSVFLHPEDGKREKDRVLQSFVDFGYRVLASNAGSLKELSTFRNSYLEDKCGDVCNCISREEKGRSLISCLVKMLQITRFQGKIKEIQMIKHFLDYLTSLKKMEIYREDNRPTNVEVSENHEIIMMMFRLCDQFYSCDVQFMDKKWTNAQ